MAERSGRQRIGTIFLGIFFVKFKESEGKRYWYQIDIDDWEDGPNEERRKELESQGWEYKDTIPGSSYHIYRCTEEKKPFHRDSEFCRAVRRQLDHHPVGGGSVPVFTLFQKRYASAGN